MEDFNRNELIERLKRLDEEAYLLYGDDDRRFHLIIVGGGALVLLEMITRSTHNLDILDASHELYGLMSKYDINGQVQTFINNFPYNYLDRVTRLPVEGRIIDFYTASLEDIVIAKLYSMRPSDRRDITDPKVLSMLDWNRLEHLAYDEDEAKASALNERLYKNFLLDYEDYVKEYRP